VLLELKVIRVQLDQKVQQDLLVLKDKKELKVVKVLKEILVLKDKKVLQVHKEIRVQQDLKDKKEN
jgi:hypothetical protein